jgi:hypothetical protein
LQIDDHKLRKKYPDAFIMVALEGYIKPYEACLGLASARRKQSRVLSVFFFPLQTVKEELQRYSVPGCVFNDSKRYLYVPASQLGMAIACLSGSMANRNAGGTLKSLCSEQHNNPHGNLCGLLRDKRSQWRTGLPVAVVHNARKCNERRKA